MKKRKQRSFSLIVFFGILASLAIIVTACTQKSARTEGSTQSHTHHANEHEGGPGDDYEALPPGFGYPYTAILDGDLSEFAGIWVNGQRSSRVLMTNGTFGEGNPASFRREENGSYTWGISFASGGGNGVQLYPAGVEVSQRPGQTDTTKDRILIISSGDSAYNPDEFYYREGEALFAISSDPHPEILNGDLSAFAGTWVNGEGRIQQLNKNGSIYNGVDVRDYNKTGDGTNLIYTWRESAMGDSFEVTLYPAGTVVIRNGDLYQSDTTKVRIGVYVNSSDEIYYREWELPTENDSSTGDPNGQWRFESGSNINFFGQEFITVSPNGHIEIWGVRPGESYLSGGAYTKETAFWEINDGGELAVYHESGVNGVFYFSIAIKNDVMNITDQNGNSAVFQKVYLQ